MEFNQDLYNATVIGENSESAFLVEGNKLHAVEKSVAALKKDKSKPEAVLPLMRNALKALTKFAKEKIPEIDLKSVSLKQDEQDQLIEKIVHIYTHLHHNVRNSRSLVKKANVYIAQIVRSGSFKIGRVAAMC